MGKVVAKVVKVTPTSRGEAFAVLRLPGDAVDLVVPVVLDPLDGVRVRAGDEAELDGGRDSASAVRVRGVLVAKRDLRGLREFGPFRAVAR